MSGGWRDGPMAAFDLETTGVDVEQDRIVSASVPMIPAAIGSAPRTPKIWSWLANPGIEIPEGAVAVHGITNEYARQHGGDPREVTEKVTGLLRLALSEGIPIVGMNLVYDLTLLDRECWRYGVKPLADSPEFLRPVIDLFVIDKAADPFRPKEPDGTSTRTLSGLCKLWKVPLEGAHNSTTDALVSARVLHKMARAQIPREPSDRPYRTPALDIGPMSLDELHDAQVIWRAEQSKSFAKWLRGKASQQRDPAEQERIRKEADEMRPEWPFIPRPTEPEASQGSLW